MWDHRSSVKLPLTASDDYLGLIDVEPPASRRTGQDLAVVRRSSVPKTASTPLPGSRKLSPASDRVAADVIADRHSCGAVRSIWVPSVHLFKKGRNEETEGRNVTEDLKNTKTMNQMAGLP